MPDNGLTEQQRKWMATVRAGLEKNSGKSMDEWLVIAATCPLTAPRAKQKWFKDTHGLGQNYFMLVMEEQARGAGVVRRDPQTMAKDLWADPGAQAILAAIEAALADLPGLVAGQRKGFNSWSRTFAFAAARPAKDTVRLGLAVEPQADARLAPTGKEGWSERLKSVVTLKSPSDVDEGLKNLLKTAWEKS